MFDGYVFVDERPSNDSNEPAIHIYTRPFDLSMVKPRDSLTIYTTAVLRSVMVYDEENPETLQNSIKILNEGGIAYNFELPNRETLWIQTFACNSKTLNVVVLFEYCERYTLYVGRFISHNSELFKDPHANKALRMQMIEKKIDDLYIDMSTADICEFNLQRSACDEIENLVKGSNHEFHMLVDDFGYEDLLFCLAKKGINIYLDNKRTEIFKRLYSLQYFCSDPSKADIILVNELSTNIQRQHNRRDIIGIKFDPYATKETSTSDSLRVIKYSICPTSPDIQYIASISAPLHVYAVGTSTKLPFNINYLCRYDDSCDKENHYIPH